MGLLCRRTPDSGALNAFLQKQRVVDAVHYPDLSLAIIKLMGPGEYVLAKGDEDEAAGALRAGDTGLCAFDGS